MRKKPNEKKIRNDAPETIQMRCAKDSVQNKLETRYTDKLTVLLIEISRVQHTYYIFSQFDSAPLSICFYGVLLFKTYTTLLKHYID